MGTTSACAENTTCGGSGANFLRNYLRVRGEYKEASVYEMTYVELPPRARRIRCASIKLPSCPGTTSACAENTQTPLLKQHRTRNYLRVRGEYIPGQGLNHCFAELPPRARRIQQFIETYEPIVRNYLRVRGEYPSPIPRPVHAMELPPRARRIPCCIHPHRII